MEIVNLQVTPYQVKFLLKVLKKYKQLRKSHFYETSGGYKREKITDELIVTNGLIAYLEEIPSE